MKEDPSVVGAPMQAKGHLFTPYPMSTGEAWCKQCGLVESAHAPLRIPYCIQWGTQIPTIDGPYYHGWDAHNSCPESKHGWFEYR